MSFHFFLQQISANHSFLQQSDIQPGNTKRKFGVGLMPRKEGESRELSEELVQISSVFIVLAFTSLSPTIMISIIDDKDADVRMCLQIARMKSTVYWLAYFILFAIFVLVLSIAGTLIIGLLLFDNIDYIILFILLLELGLSVITLTFMFTPFITRQNVAGICGTLLSVLSFVFIGAIQVYYSTFTRISYWFGAMWSPAAFEFTLQEVICARVFVLSN